MLPTVRISYVLERSCGISGGFVVCSETITRHREQILWREENNRRIKLLIDCGDFWGFDGLGYLQSSGEFVEG